MRIRLAAATTILLVVALLALWLAQPSCLGCPAPSSAGDPSLHGLELCFGTDDRLNMDYYGSGASAHRGWESEDLRSLELRFEAMHLPAGASYTYDDNPYIDCRVRGSLVRSGEDGNTIDLALKIDSEVPFEVVLHGMAPEGIADSDEEFFSFEPGTHSFEFRGSISRWYEVENE